MREVIKDAFERTLEFLPSEFAVVPLTRWSEAVFRYHFCRFVSETHPNVRQDVECDRIDLVLRRPPETAFVEFKFYTHPPRFDAYTGKPSGFKGGPGNKNFSEFKDCIKQLADRRGEPGLSRYVVLFYADSEEGPPRKQSYSIHYDDYKYPDREVTVQVLAQTSFHADKHKMTCKLYEIGISATPGSVPERIGN